MSEPVEPAAPAVPAQPVNPLSGFVGTKVPHANEPVLERYARQTRNATVTLAWIVGVLAAISLIGAIVTAAAINNLNNQLQNAINGGGGTTSNSNCVSQGGTDPTC
jgi:hypothetical protein